MAGNGKSGGRDTPASLNQTMGALDPNSFYVPIIEPPAGRPWNFADTALNQAQAAFVQMLLNAADTPAGQAAIEKLIQGAQWLDDNSLSIESWLGPTSNSSRMAGSLVAGHPQREGGPLLSEALEDRGVPAPLALLAELFIPDGTGKLGHMVQPMLGLIPGALIGLQRRLGRHLDPNLLDELGTPLVSFHGTGDGRFVRNIDTALNAEGHGHSGGFSTVDTEYVTRYPYRYDGTLRSPDFRPGDGVYGYLTMPSNPVVTSGSIFPPLETVPVTPANTKLIDEALATAASTTAHSKADREAARQRYLAGELTPSELMKILEDHPGSPGLTNMHRGAGYDAHIDTRPDFTTETAVYRPDDMVPLGVEGLNEAIVRRLIANGEDPELIRRLLESPVAGVDDAVASQVQELMRRAELGFDSGLRADAPDPARIQEWTEYMMDRAANPVAAEGITGRQAGRVPPPTYMGPTPDEMKMIRQMLDDPGIVARNPRPREAQLGGRRAQQILPDDLWDLGDYEQYRRVYKDLPDMGEWAPEIVGASTGEIIDDLKKLGVPDDAAGRIAEFARYMLREPYSNLKGTPEYWPMLTAIYPDLPDVDDAIAGVRKLANLPSVGGMDASDLINQYGRTVLEGIFGDVVYDDDLFPMVVAATSMRAEPKMNAMLDRANNIRSVTDLGQFFSDYAGGTALESAMIADSAISHLTGRSAYTTLNSPAWGAFLRQNGLPDSGEAAKALQSRMMDIVGEREIMEYLAGPAQKTSSLPRPGTINMPGGVSVDLADRIVRPPLAEASPAAFLEQMSKAGVRDLGLTPELMNQLMTDERLRPALLEAMEAIGFDRAEVMKALQTISVPGSLPIAPSTLAPGAP